MTARIEFHYDGPIALDHQISLRVLSATLVHLQSAIDRAYLDTRYGNVWKFQKLKKNEYPFTDFIVGTPQEGGYILDLIRDGGEAIVRRVSSAITNVRAAPWQAGQDEIVHLAAQAVTRLNQLDRGIYRGRSLAEFANDPQMEEISRFGDRSIGKEIDQILTHIRRTPPDDAEGENTVKFSFEYGKNRKSNFVFDQDDALVFHRTVSRRELGEPLRYAGTLRAIDRGKKGVGEQRPKAKLTLADTNRDIILHIGSSHAYDELAPFMQGNEVIEIFASPILEFNSFDPNSGDAFFIRLA